MRIKTHSSHVFLLGLINGKKCNGILDSSKYVSCTKMVITSLQILDISHPLARWSGAMVILAPSPTNTYSSVWANNIHHNLVEEKTPKFHFIRSYQKLIMIVKFEYKLSHCSQETCYYHERWLIVKIDNPLLRQTTL